MARNEHKKDLRQLSEAYQKVQNENLFKLGAVAAGWGHTAKELAKSKKGRPEPEPQKRESDRERWDRKQREGKEKYTPEEIEAMTPEERQRKASISMTDDERKESVRQHSAAVAANKAVDARRGVVKKGMFEDEEDDDEWNRAENERESARDRAGELSDDWMRKDYESREDSSNANVNLKDEVADIQNRIEKFVDSHFEAEDYDNIAKALHNVKTILSDISELASDYGDRPGAFGADYDMDQSEVWEPAGSHS